LFSYAQTRDSARALLGAVCSGSAVGLMLAGAYLGGGLANTARTESMAATQAPSVQTVSQDAAAAPSIPTTIRRQGARSEELLKASFAGPAAAPFRLGAGSDRDLQCLTEAVYYEARGEGRAGQAAVAQVVLNRVRHPAFPKSVCAVVFQGCQFSFACNGAMRARRESGAWNRAQRVASEALAGAVAANVGNATHFHTIHVSPNWSNLMRVGQVGLHVFYRFGGRAGRASAFNAQPQPSSDTVKSDSGLTYARYVPPVAEQAVNLIGSAQKPAVTIAPAGTPVAQVTQAAQTAKPVEPGASAPVATAAPAAQPAAVEVKVSASAQLTPSKATSATAS
jgi:spore germination cell wall hydrolase CwlJ-like protein